MPPLVTVGGSRVSFCCHSSYGHGKGPFEMKTEQNFGGSSLPSAQGCVSFAGHTRGLGPPLPPSPKRSPQLAATGHPGHLRVLGPQAFPWASPDRPPNGLGDYST